jgi:hypothetical protein
MTSLLFHSSHCPPIFDSVEQTIAQIPPKAHLKILPQILIYQYTHNLKLHSFAFEIIRSLLTQFPNRVIFPLFFTQGFGHLTPEVADLLLKFSAEYPEFYDTAHTIHVWES